ncbi:MAG: thioesterase [Desulfuromonas sp.]|nr:MAG: thioesterase [Desulfuromonas sp.]
MSDFKFTIPYSARIADINYGNHVSNAAVMNFFQDGRIAYLEHFDCSELDIGGVGLIMPEAHVRYHREMFLGDVLQIAVRIESMRKSSFIMEYQISRDDEITVEGSTNLVAFDYDKRKTARIPLRFRESVADFEGRSEWID